MCRQYYSNTRKWCGSSAEEKRTKNDLRAHPLAVQLQACDSPSTILAVLQERVPGLESVGIAKPDRNGRKLTMADVWMCD